MASATSLRAAEIEIVCNQSDTSCIVTSSDTAPLFDENNFPEYDLKPGDEFTREIEVTNNREEICHFTLDNFVIHEDTVTSTNVKFSEELLTQFSTNGFSTGEIPFANLFSLSPLFVGNIQIGETKIFEWSVKFDKDAGNEFQKALLKFDFDWAFSCGEEGDSILFIQKSNNTGGATLSPGSSVIYTLIVSTDDTPVDDVYVLDLTPKGFIYRSGSWTADSSLRGNLVNSPTTEPTYASPGTWFLGDLAAHEVVTLTYIADIDGSVDPGTYPDLAWAYGDFEGGLVLANATVSPQYFVGTEVIVDYRVNPSATFDEDRVLGAATVAFLPATGATTRYLIFAVGSMIFGLCFILYSRALRRRNNYETS